MINIYTKTGDDGTTGILNGIRILKSDPVIEMLGTLDEVSASLGLIFSDTHSKLSIFSDKSKIDIKSFLTDIMRDLFEIGCLVSCKTHSELKLVSHITEERITFFEHFIDTISERLSPLDNFIFPTGDRVAAKIFMARALIRRAERTLVGLSTTTVEDFKLSIIYLNRLSDLFFVLGRYFNMILGASELKWIPEKQEHR